MTIGTVQIVRVIAMLAFCVAEVGGLQAQSAAGRPRSLTPAERVHGLSLIWREAAYNFAFFDQVPELNWDSAYQAFIPIVLDAGGTWEYYRELQRFTALLRDGHTGVSMPPSLAEETRRRDTYPWVVTRRVEDRLLVTAVGRSLADSLPPYSEITTIDGRPAGEVAFERRAGFTFAGTEHHRMDRVFQEALFGAVEEPVRIEYVTPAGESGSATLSRDRRTRQDGWQPELVTQPPFAFRWIGSGDIALIELNTFNDTIVPHSFEAAIPELRRARGLVLDVRRNDGGVSPYGYRIAAWLTVDSLRAPAWQTPEHRAALKAWGQWDPRYRAYFEMNAWYRDALDPMPPANGQPLLLPIVVLQDHGTFSAAEDFVILVRDLPHVTTMGRHTGGATGQPLFFRLPGGGSARIATVRDTDFDGVRGYAPEVYVALTAADLRSGRDAALERAIELLRRAGSD